MSQSDPFQSIFPDFLESLVQETGDLIGETLKLQEETCSQGDLQEIFLAPKKKFGLADFEVKGHELDPVHLLFDLDLAIELAGRLIILPQDEIKANKKTGKLEGELLDAFAEIVNIISGVLNSSLQEAFPGKKLHFIKGNLEIFPAKAKDLPLPRKTQTLLAGEVALGDQKLGFVRFFLPHSLLEDQATPQAAQAGREETGPVESDQTGQGSDSKPEESPPPPETRPESKPQSGLTGQNPFPQEKIEPEVVDPVLLETLAQAGEEIESLLGVSVEFLEQQTRPCSRQDFLAQTKGKQVLAKIQATGERTGQGYLLLPLKDAVYFGGLLLMMPVETITETIKQGKFDGEVVDSFAEIANILIGCFSKQFKAELPLKLSLKKEGDLQTLVPAQVDPNADQPFQAKEYYLLSSRIRMEDKTYGPLEFLFPLDLLGLSPSTPDPEETRREEPVQDSPQEKGCQNPVPGQKHDTDPEPVPENNQSRIISIIAEDHSQVEIDEQSIANQGLQLTRLSLKSDFKQSLTQEDPCCVFLLISKVNDQGLALTIKVRSALKSECPLIVAGPEWTRTTVFKALKYGATDILITPADQESIRKKYQKYLQG